MGTALGGVAGFAFASEWFDSEDPMFGPLTSEEREMLDAMLAVEGQRA